MTEVAERFALVNADLATGRPVSIPAGVAALEPDDSLHELVRRADQAMYRERDRRAPDRTGRAGPSSSAAATDALA